MISLEPSLLFALPDFSSLGIMGEVQDLRGKYAPLMRNTTYHCLRYQDFKELSALVLSSLKRDFFFFLLKPGASYFQ